MKLNKMNNLLMTPWMLLSQESSNTTNYSSKKSNINAHKKKLSSQSTYSSSSSSSSSLKDIKNEADKENNARLELLKDSYLEEQRQQDSAYSSSSSQADHNESDEGEALLRLHKEILLFNEYISPTVAELTLRNDIIWRITRVIKQHLPQVDVDVFGSYKTGLFLPTSDIDMVVFGEWRHHAELPLGFLRDALIREKISGYQHIQVLDKASVPIIKIFDQRTLLKIDISFNTINGVKSAEVITKYLGEFPCLKPLVMVLKQFLMQRGLNEVWTGGISSYSLILMVISFLQSHSRCDPYSSYNNLGVLLIEFLEFYGRSFNYMTTAIRLAPQNAKGQTSNGCFVPKEELIKQFNSVVSASFNLEDNFGCLIQIPPPVLPLPQHPCSFLCIEDPLDPFNDIAKASYAIEKVKQAFEYAFFALNQVLWSQNNSQSKNIKKNKANKKSLLGCIIFISREMSDYREWIANTFEMHTIFDLNITPNEEIYPINQKKVKKKKKKNESMKGFMAAPMLLQSHQPVLNHFKPIETQLAFHPSNNTNGPHQLIQSHLAQSHPILIANHGSLHEHSSPNHSNIYHLQQQLLINAPNFISFNNADFLDNLNEKANYGHQISPNLFFISNDTNSFHSFSNNHHTFNTHMQMIDV